MTRSRIYQTTAVVLRYRPLGETDRLINFFTKSLGRVTAVAKGVRRPGSRFGGTLEPLNLVQLSLARGRNLDNVNECVTINSFEGLKGDLSTIAQGIYLAELVDSFSDDWASNIALFSLLTDSLNHMNLNKTSDLFIRIFELKLLNCSGFGPEFEKCVGCGSDLEPASYGFHFEYGGALCGDCESEEDIFLTRISLDTMKLLRWIQRQNENISDIKIPSVSEQSLRETTVVMRDYLKYVIEHDIRATSFLDEMKFEST